MALNSAQFVAFLCAACLLTYVFPRGIRYLWLLVCSCTFYAWCLRGFALRTPSTLVGWGLPDSLPAWVPGVALAALVTAASWLCGLAIGKSRRRLVRVPALCLGVAALVGLWAGCKYFGLLSPLQLYVGGIVTEGNANGFVEIALPLGLSYYTVQAVGYLADVFCHRAQAETNPLRYTGFLLFFPGILLGPTARAGQMLPQFRTPATFDYERITGGIFRILWGFFKKVVLADTLAGFTKYVLGDTMLSAGPLLVLATVLFVWQLYLDFSGCCDIAIGATRMLGFDYAENFLRPFSAHSFSGFWRRWFMSLGGLLRDIVYTPLVNSRWPSRVPLLGKFLRWPPALTAGALTFALLGAWHGLDADYLWWGLFTGLLYGVSRLSQPLRDKIAGAVPLYQKPAVRGVFQRLFTFLLVCGTMLFFASAYYQQPFFEWAGQLGQGWALLGGGDFWPAVARAGLDGWKPALLLGGSALVAGIEHFAVSTESTVAHWVRQRRFFVRWPLYLALLAAILFFGVFPVHEGIYQGF